MVPQVVPQKLRLPKRGLSGWERNSEYLDAQGRSGDARARDDHADDGSHVLPGMQEESAARLDRLLRG